MLITRYSSHRNILDSVELLYIQPGLNVTKCVFTKCDTENAAAPNIEGQTSENPAMYLQPDRSSSPKLASLLKPYK
ncbi:hypothetical protein CEXT_65521 [Caerostris extrusa]|nr:hypothetical protein CEXT_65521 [Caerostris extrusa]